MVGNVLKKSTKSIIWVCSAYNKGYQLSGAKNLLSGQQEVTQVFLSHCTLCLEEYQANNSCGAAMLFSFPISGTIFCTMETF